MDEKTNEQVYDELILPRLQEIAQVCDDHKMSFVACVEIEPGHFGNTILLHGSLVTLLGMARAVLESLRKGAQNAP